MKLGKTVYAKTRAEWRAWLRANHKTAPEIWLIYYNKASRKPRIPYNHAVDEALCFGWIDSILKKVDAERFAQRFSPRRERSNLSEMNRERVRRLIRSGRMRKAGLEAVRRHLDDADLSGRRPTSGSFETPKDILRALKRDSQVWRNFQRFPESYRRIRVGWIDGARHRPDFFKRRLAYFIKMTAKNKRFGMVQ